MATVKWTGATDGDVSNDANWDAVKPVNGDDVYFGAGVTNSPSTNMNALAAVHPATVRVCQAYTSSFAIGASGSPLELDYVETYLIFDSPASEAWFEFKSAANNSTVIVNGTGTGANALRLKCGAGMITLNLLKGKATVDSGSKLAGGTIVGTGGVAGDAQLTIQASVTWAVGPQIFQYGGVIVSDSGAAALTLISLGGIATFQGTAQLASFWGHGGTLTYTSSANLAQVILQRGTFDASGSPGFTMTSAEVYSNVTFNIANGLRSIAITQGIKMHGTAVIYVDSGRVLTPGT